MITSRMENKLEDRSLGELVSKLAADTGKLIRHEMRLVVAETRQNITSLTDSIVWIASGLVAGVAGVFAILSATILLLAMWLPPWLAAAIVGLALIVAGILLANYGWSSLKKVELTPDDSIESIKENTEWLKEQIKN